MAMERKNTVSKDWLLNHSRTYKSKPPVEASEVMLEMSEEFLESKQMDEAVIRTTITEERLL